RTWWSFRGAERSRASPIAITRRSRATGARSSSPGRSWSWIRPITSQTATRCWRRCSPATSPNSQRRRSSASPRTAGASAVNQRPERPGERCCNYALLGDEAASCYAGRGTSCRGTPMVRLCALVLAVAGPALAAAAPVEVEKGVALAVPDTWVRAPVESENSLHFLAVDRTAAKPAAAHVVVTTEHRTSHEEAVARLPRIDRTSVV